ncbi:MAG: WG repeat-containing protein [Bacteroidota bacterium]|nr:WG repeat-containing protein [Bacteroidota bacterium]
MFAIILSLLFNNISTDSIVAIDINYNIVFVGSVAAGATRQSVSDIVSSKKLSSKPQKYFQKSANNDCWIWVTLDNKSLSDTCIQEFYSSNRTGIWLKTNNLWKKVDSEGKALNFNKYLDFDQSEKIILGRKAGFLEIKNVNIQTEKYYNFENGTISVEGEMIFQSGFKYGLLDLKSDKIIINTEYQTISYIDDSLFLVKKQNKFGVINRHNKVIVPLIYDRIRVDSSKNIFVSLLTYRQIHENLANIRVEDETMGLYNRYGKLIIPILYSAIELTNDKWTKVWKSDWVGLLDKSGKEVIECKFTKLGKFNFGLCPAGKGVYSGVIDTTGKWVVNPSYSEIIQVNDSVWICKKSENSAVFFFPKSRKFDVVLYEDLKPIGLGFIRFTANESFGLLNARLKVVLKPEWTSIRIHEPEKIIVAAKIFYYSIFYLNGNLKVFMNYPFTKFDNYQNGMAMVIHHDKYGFIDKDGALLVSTQYDGARHFKNNMAAIQIGNKWGLINKNESIIISPNYDTLLDFNGFCCPVKKNGKWGFVDGQGKEVLKPQYDDVLTALNGYYYVRLGSKIGLVSNTGIEIINPVYRDCEMLNDKVVKIRPYTKYGLVDLYNKPLSKMEYDQITYSKKANKYIFIKNPEWVVVK